MSFVCIVISILVNDSFFFCSSFIYFNNTVTSVCSFSVFALSTTLYIFIYIYIHTKGPLSKFQPGTPYNPNPPWCEVLFSDQPSVQQFHVRMQHVWRARAKRLHKKYTVFTAKRPQIPMVCETMSAVGTRVVSGPIFKPEPVPNAIVIFEARFMLESQNYRVSQATYNCGVSKKCTGIDAGTRFYHTQNSNHLHQNIGLNKHNLMLGSPR